MLWENCSNRPGDTLGFSSPAPVQTRLAFRYTSLTLLKLFIFLVHTHGAVPIWSPLCEDTALTTCLSSECRQAAVLLSTFPRRFGMQDAGGNPARFHVTWWLGAWYFRVSAAWGAMLGNWKRSCFPQEQRSSSEQSSQQGLVLKGFLLWLETGVAAPGTATMLASSLMITSNWPGLDPFAVQFPLSSSFLLIN